MNTLFFEILEAAEGKRVYRGRVSSADGAVVESLEGDNLTAVAELLWEKFPEAEYAPLEWVAPMTWAEMLRYRPDPALWDSK